MTLHGWGEFSEFRFSRGPVVQYSSTVVVLAEGLIGIVVFTVDYSQIFARAARVSAAF